MELTELAPNMSVGPQIGPDDLDELARRGFTDIVCNRPDEEHGVTSGSEALGARAETLGLAFHYLPIRHGHGFEAQAERMGEILRRPGTKMFAYCRSGARSSNAWALAQTDRAGA
jgi:sulfide:quinone oxidoreductase